MSAERLDIPGDLLQRFEDELDPAHPERTSVPVEVLGYGEMSTVLGFDAPGYADFAFKRMALFHTSVEVEDYEALFVEYHEVLGAMGLRLPGYGVNRVDSAGDPVLYLSQRRLPASSIGDAVVRLLPATDAVRFILAALEASAPVFDHNAEVGLEGRRVGLDIQLSNWSVEGFDPLRPKFTGHEALTFIDTSTPMISEGGQSLLNPELFLRLCPASLVWLIELFFLDDVIERYFHFRDVAVDLLANLIKERRRDLIAPAAEAVNAFLAERGAHAPITPAEVEDYYREDAFIWWLFLALRRMEAAWNTRVLGRRYNIILPGRIAR